jgi:hypothetical protein
MRWWEIHLPGTKKLTHRKLTRKMSNYLHHRRQSSFYVLHTTRSRGFMRHPSHDQNGQSTNLIVTTSQANEGASYIKLRIQHISQSMPTHKIGWTIGSRVDLLLECRLE